MKRRGLERRWLWCCLAAAGVLAVGVAVFSLSLRAAYYRGLTELLTARARSGADVLRLYLDGSAAEDAAAAARYAEAFADRERLEFEFIDRNGRVLYSSSFGPLSGYEPGTPDAADAVERGQAGSYRGRDRVTGARVISASAPVYRAGGERTGAVRYVTGLGAADARVRRLTLTAAAAAAVCVAAAWAAGAAFLATVVSSVDRVTAAAREIAAGNYGAGPAKRRDDEIGELAEALDGVSAEIERSEKVKNDFISSVSHELRTPLTAISGWAETLAADVTDPDSLEAKGLETIRKESGRLGGIVEELLDFSKLGAGHEVLNRTAFDLNAELAETIFMMEQRLAQDGVHVVYTDATGDAPVWGDRQRIRQVFVNLLDNARGFSKPGDAVDVTIEESGRTGFVAVRVRDHGPGIAPEDLPHVKEKFYKGKNSRQGSGIGLALSDEIVALHGGTLTIQSPPGEGVTATVELPLYER